MRKESTDANAVTTTPRARDAAVDHAVTAAMRARTGLNPGAPRAPSGAVASEAAPSSVITPPPPSSRRAPFFLTDRYEDITFLGEGGMGTVYRVRDARLGRQVAIKLLKGADPDLWPRFIAEAKAQALVEHENVCRVYDTGETDGQPYIAMQYIDGVPLSDLADSLTIEQHVRIIQKIALAVHEAHRVGLIHRDIKPGNILLEKQESGAYKPYILDFGLARRAGERGQTQSGEIIGTLAYMSPEQARGDWRNLDRRSDVFSLGATLYDMIAGRPPFFAEFPFQILFMVTHEDAARIRKVKPEIPAALETIVMKCVEREPARRYESARALAEDLGRFLDGAPILARPASWTQVLKKKARKHKLATALLGALFVGALVLAAVWLHGERRAAEQAQIARDLALGVKEMELFLRTAYAMPLHDVERERDIVRKRLAQLSERMAAAGEAGEGPGQYALGQGYLSLGDPSSAREHLERADAAGYPAPELQYALGTALGALFSRALEETKRITNEDERKEKVAELERELRDPALLYLRAAVGAKIEVPAYAEGLIALYEGRNEDAVAKAKEAFVKAPWLYEAKKLEGDALFAEGSKYRHDAAFDYDRMKGYFDQAERAYSIAAELGRSDPSVHLAQCELWEKTGWAAYNKPLPFEGPFDAADAACLRAVQSSSRDRHALVQRALVLAARVYAESNGTPSPRVLDIADQAVDAAEESQAAYPEDIMTHYAVARALSERTRLLGALGEHTSMETAIDGYERVLMMDPRLTWAINELGEALLFDATQAESRGRDGSASAARAVQMFERAIALDPKFALPVGGRLRALSSRVELRIARGQDAHELLAALSEAASSLEKDSFGPSLAAIWKARAQRLRAQDDLAWGRDPRPASAAALETIRAFAGEQPEDYWLLEEVAKCHLIDATHALSAGADPRRSVDLARAAAQRALAKEPSMSPLLRAQIELVAARAGAGAGPEVWDSALAAVAPLLSSDGREPEAFALAAEILACRADTSLKAGRSPGDDLRRGLAAAGEALAMNPAMARAHLAKGYLHLSQARAERSEQPRAEAWRLAEAAFDAAIRHNPLLAKERASVPEGR
jgi:eukaryotic-like serine/threonine-protein kinase